ncbi:MAG: CRISPR-associated protein Csn2 [Candidatus Methanomethylophilaceae archaeon]|nr:CRISPR-associated protein Csn2 [Candidatus Methanomethylophilaceae archaeon]
MILGHYTFETPINIIDGRMHYLVVENPSQLTQYVQDLLSQRAGSIGEFVLWDEGNELKLNEMAEIVIDPFSLDPNTKCNLGNLYSRIKEEAYDEVNFLTTDRLLSELTIHIDKIVSQQSISASCSNELQLQSLLKSLGVGFCLDSESLLSSIVDYIQIVSSFSKKRLIIFANLRSYLTSVEISELSDFISYSKTCVLFLETQVFEFSGSDYVKVIDNDLCEFNIGENAPKSI